MHEKKNTETEHKGTHSTITGEKKETTFSMLNRRICDFFLSAVLLNGEIIHTLEINGITAH